MHVMFVSDVPIEVSRALVQISFLSAFLSLVDMRDENFGLDAGFNPIIIDFMMSNYGDPKTKFLGDNRTIHFSDKSFNAILDNCASAERLQIAKDALQAWDFGRKLDETLKQMDQEKVNFGRKQLDFEKKTKDLEEFVARVKSNVRELLFQQVGDFFAIQN